MRKSNSQENAWLLYSSSCASDDLSSEPVLVTAEPAASRWGSVLVRTYSPSGEGRATESEEYTDDCSADWLRLRYPGHVAMAPTLMPGQFFPRIWRNGLRATGRCPRDQQAFPRDLQIWRRDGAIAVHRLLEQLAFVFDVIEPCSANVNAFGPATRDLLFLACTEVEAALRGVLLANQQSGNEDAVKRLSTKDYVSLLGPMRLNEYRLRLALYQSEWDLPVSPFEAWNDDAPTRSLPWYDAYNAAKHDRENARRQATLRACIDSVAAACILLVAQFGTDSNEVRRVLAHVAGFEFVSSPVWRHDEQYFPASVDGFRAVRCL